MPTKTRATIIRHGNNIKKAYFHFLCSKLYPINVYISAKRTETARINDILTNKIVFNPMPSIDNTLVLLRIKEIIAITIEK